MELSMLKCKIHRATVTEANLDYVGSITIDGHLMDQCGLLEYEKVQVVNINNGNRIETYTIRGEPNSGVICLNGASARLFAPNDKVIIMSFATMTAEEARQHHPFVLIVNEHNHPTNLSSHEKHVMNSD